MSDHLDIDRLEGIALHSIDEQRRSRAIRELVALAREGKWCRDVFERDPLSFLEGYKEMETELEAAEADRDRLAETLREAGTAIERATFDIHDREWARGVGQRIRAALSAADREKQHG